MSRKLTHEECYARSEAFIQCRDLMDLNWFDTDVEHEQSVFMKRFLENHAQKWHSLGFERKQEAK